MEAHKTRLATVIYWQLISKMSYSAGVPYENDITLVPILVKYSREHKKGVLAAALQFGSCDES